MLLLAFSKLSRSYTSPKRNVISVIDGVVRSGRDIDEALDYIDAKMLVGVLRFDEDTCREC